MWTLMGLLACVEEKKEEAADFLVIPVALGSPLASDTQFAPGDPAGLGAALAATLPLFGGNPTWDAPWDAWALQEGSTVQDEGVCPRTVVLDDGARYESDCRSTDGYEFSGAAESREWSADGMQRRRLELSMEVIGDGPDPEFDSLQLEGFLEQATPDSGTVVQHMDINLRLDVRGWFEERAPQDPRLTAWQGWAVTGSLEEYTDGRWQIDATIMSGGQGARVKAALEAGCPVELKGLADLSGEQLQLNGADGCDACGEMGDAMVCAP